MSKLAPRPTRRYLLAGTSALGVAALTSGASQHRAEAADGSHLVIGANNTGSSGTKLTNSTLGTVLWVESTSVNDGTGVQGIGADTGVAGYSTKGVGVSGNSDGGSSTNSIGVEGSCASAIGVRGYTASGTGVRAEANSGTALRASASSSSGTAVSATG